MARNASKRPARSRRGRDARLRRHLCGPDPDQTGSGPAPERQPDGGAPARTTDGQIRQLQTQVRGAHEPDLGRLGETYLQKVRETGDASYYTRADGVLRRALALKPEGLEGLVGTGTLALARHDFLGGLRYGLAAHRVAPGLARPLGVIVDAEVELGRYGAAARTLQRMVDLQPNLASYARVSYLRELHGDLPGALYAMRLAVSSGGGAPENVAYVQTLLGNLLFEAGDLRAARAAYEQALRASRATCPPAPDLPRSTRPGAAGSRRSGACATRSPGCPCPSTWCQLGETEQAAGRRRRRAARSGARRRRGDAAAGKRRQHRRRPGPVRGQPRQPGPRHHAGPARVGAGAQRALGRLAGLGADSRGRRGPASRGRDARCAWARSTRPSSITPGWRRERPGTRRWPPWLRRALAHNPRFSPLYAPRAQAALR